MIISLPYVLSVSTVIIQLHLRPVSECTVWVVSAAFETVYTHCMWAYINFPCPLKYPVLVCTQDLQTETKLSEISASLSVLLQQNCVCPLSIEQRFFSCLGTSDSQTVVFLAQLSYVELPGGMNIPSLITSWVTSSRAILVNSIQLQVDTNCPVVIDSLNSKSCTDPSIDPPTNPPTNPPTDFTVITIAVCVAILLVVIVLVAAVVAVVVLRRKWSKYRYAPHIHYSLHAYLHDRQFWITAHVIHECNVFLHPVMKCSQYFVPCFLFRPNRPLPNPVYDEYEYIGSNTGGVALENMTKNPAYVTKKEAVTSFSSNKEAGKGEEDHTYEELPFDANEGEQGGTAHGILQDATLSVQVVTVECDQSVAEGEVYESAN